MTSDLATKKIALVHDYLLGIGGAERVLKVLHEMFPHAPIYAVVYDKKFVKRFFVDCHNGPCPDLVRGSFLQKLPLFLRKRYKYFSFLIPSAVECLDLSGFDIVISSCSAFSKGVITRPDAVHICYCHTPTRYLWDWAHPYFALLNGKAQGFLAKILIHFLRLWDREAARRVDYFIANSKHVAARIKKYYGRDAQVIYPPVDKLPITNYKLPMANDFYLIVSQLRPYKQIDIAIEAFKKLGFPLVVIGEGSDRKRLLKLARGAKNIKFLGWLDDGAVNEYYKNCRAFIYPCEEDFGIAMVEAMLFGKPVLALREGGAKEIVIPGITGEFFDDAHPVVLADGLRRLNQNYTNYSPILIQKRAGKFSRERFYGEVFEFVEKCCKIQL
ncbi:MAG: glycosyltransferase [Candidatus Spechtbacterales bacterium]